MLEGTWGTRGDPVRILAVRPDYVRVQRLDGTAVGEVRQGSVSGGGVLLTSDGRHVPQVPPLPSPPDLDSDGLVSTARRPGEQGPEVPFWHDYRFVAVLDPYELSDGVDVLELAAVEHGGRPAWEALLRPTPAYEPRCSCCPLMRSQETDLIEGFDPLPAYADAHRVRLDVGTGICVRTREVGGPWEGQGHDLIVTHATL